MRSRHKLSIHPLCQINPAPVLRQTIADTIRQPYGNYNESEAPCPFPGIILALKHDASPGISQEIKADNLKTRSLHFRRFPKSRICHAVCNHETNHFSDISLCRLFTYLKRQQALNISFNGLVYKNICVIIKDLLLIKRRTFHKHDIIKLRFQQRPHCHAI